MDRQLIPPKSLREVPIYAINLNHRTDRWSKLIEHMAAVGLPSPKRVSAVNGRETSTDEEIENFWCAAHASAPGGSPGTRAAAIGAAKTFKALLETLSETDDWTMIVEDDVEFLPDVRERYEEFARLVPEDAHMLLLGCTHRSRPQPVPGTDRLVWRVRRADCSHCFLVAPEAIPLLKEAHALLTRPFDVTWQVVQTLGRTYCPNPHLGVQRRNFSDISGRVISRLRAQYGPELA